MRPTLNPNHNPALPFEHIRSWVDQIGRGNARTSGESKGEPNSPTRTGKRVAVPLAATKPVVGRYPKDSCSMLNRSLPFVPLAHPCMTYERSDARRLASQS